jgi:hypothetical protein
MQRVTIKLLIICVWLIFAVGCEPAANSADMQTADPNSPLFCETYLPVRVKTLPLSRIVRFPDGSGRVNAFVDLRDGFESRVKAPAQFRFELYEYVPRSVRQEGKRLKLWKQIDLRDNKTNTAYWRGHLRSYEFLLDIGAGLQAERKYVLEATVTTVRGVRLSDSVVIETRQ